MYQGGIYTRVVYLSYVQGGHIHQGVPLIPTEVYTRVYLSYPRCIPGMSPIPTVYTQHVSHTHGCTMVDTSHTHGCTMVDTSHTSGLTLSDTRVIPQG